MSPFRITLSEATRLRANTPIRSEEPSSYLMYEGQFIPRLKTVGFLAALSVRFASLRRWIEWQPRTGRNGGHVLRLGELQRPGLEAKVQSLELENADLKSCSARIKARGV